MKLKAFKPWLKADSGCSVETIAKIFREGDGGNLDFKKITFQEFKEHFKEDCYREKIKEREKKEKGMGIAQLDQWRAMLARSRWKKTMGDVNWYEWMIISAIRGGEGGWLKGLLVDSEFQQSIENLGFKKIQKWNKGEILIQTIRRTQVQGTTLLSLLLSREVRSRYPLREWACWPEDRMPYEEEKHSKILQNKLEQIWTRGWGDGMGSLEWRSSEMDSEIEIDRSVENTKWIVEHLFEDEEMKSWNLEGSFQQWVNHGGQKIMNSKWCEKMRAYFEIREFERMLKKENIKPEFERIQGIKRI